MTRLFVQVYLLIGALLVLDIWLLLNLGNQDQSDRWSSQSTALAEFPHHATRAIVMASDADQQLAAVEALEEQFGYPVQIVPRPAVLATLSDRKRGTLERGATVGVTTSEGTIVFVPVPAEPFLVRFGPVPAPGDMIALELLVPALTLLLLGLFLGLVLRSLEQQLRELSAAAQRLGSGAFEARSQLPPTAEMGGLASTFNKMAEQIQHLVRSQQDLLHAVSHELRSPLQRMTFGLDLLERAATPQDLSARVGDLQSDVKELDTLVDELLSWTRLQGGEETLHLEGTDVDELLDDLVYDAKRLERPVKISLSDLDLPDLLVDPARMRRSVGNLISNAARYGKSTVEVSAELVDDQLRIYVDDDGPGVPEADRERIFEPFVRLDDARSRDTGGIGLGLAISRQIAAAHGGGLTVARSRLGGARFCWVAPARQAEVP